VEGRNGRKEDWDVRKERKQGRKGYEEGRDVRKEEI
jgi:hypothetical protein